MSKKILSILLVLVMVMSLAPVPALAAEATEITDQAGLAKMSQGGTFKLTADITLNSWTPLDLDMNAAEGITLDGNGHTVTLNGNPLFNTFPSGSTVSNLILKGSVTSGGSVGSLAVASNGTVRNCVSYVDVTYTGEATDQCVAGLIGSSQNAFNIIRCVYAGTLNQGKSTMYGAMINKLGMSGKVEQCVGVGTDRIGTVKDFIFDTIGPMDIGEKNRLISDTGAFVPGEYVEFLNATPAEGDLEWTTGADGQLTLKTAGSVEPEVPEVPQATPEQLAALDTAIADAQSASADDVFTTATWDAFTAALNAAKSLKESGETEQAKVVEATTKLTEATAALQPLSTDTVTSDGKTVVEVNQGNFKDTIKNPEAGNYYKLTEDITIDDAYWSGLAVLNTVIDGDGHTITLKGAPLYGTIGAEGVIQNLGVLGNAQNGNSDTGALAKDCAGLVINCWSRADVSSEGANGNKKNTGGFVANLTPGGAVINSYVAGSVSAKGSQGSGTVGALVGSTAANTLVKYGYFLESVVGNAVGNAAGNVVECASKSAAEMKEAAFADLLNANRGTNGKTWNISSEGWAHFGASGDYQPDTGVTLVYTPKKGFGDGKAKEFDSKAGLTLTMLDIMGEPGAQGGDQYAGFFSYPEFQGEVAFVPQYTSAGQGNHKVFVSENGGLEVLAPGSLEVAVCDKSSLSGNEYTKELARFKVTVVDAAVEDLRLVPTGTYVTDKKDGTYEVAGSGTVTVNAQIKQNGSWKAAPASVFEFTYGGNAAHTRNNFNAKAPGKITVTAKGMGKEATVEVNSTYVPVSSVTPGPNGTYELHLRNANSEGMADFLDLTLANGAGTVVVSPENASYGDDWTLKSSDPKVAEYVESMIRAVLPRKAGTVVMTATVNDPGQEKPVVGKSKVTLKYLNPVTSVEITGAGVSVKENETIDLPLVFTGPKSAEGYHVSEPAMTWTFSGDGEVEITRQGLSIQNKDDPNGEYCVANDQYKLIGTKEGLVTVTGTPVDQTGGAKSITFDVMVEPGTPEPSADNDKIVAEGTAGALAYMQKEYDGWNYHFGDEWAVFLFTRMGHGLTASEKQNYIDSIVETYQNPKNANLKPTTIARVILTVTALGEDASNLKGIDLVDKLCQGKFMADGGNESMWALIALDSGRYEIPANAKWNRETLLEQVLTYQNPENGGFGLLDNKTVSVDMTAMAVQALAGYYDTNARSANSDLDARVKASVDKALSYLKHEMNRSCDYGTSESISQVIIALAALNRDPLDKSNGFVKSDARNLITALNAYRMDDGGFKHLVTDSKSQNLSTTQALMALEAYRRVKAGEDTLFEVVHGENPDKPADPTVPGTNPSDPTAPTVPGTNPSDPTAPTVPGTNPSDPTAPTVPGTNPSDPTAPTVPGTNPSDPTAPTTPGTNPGGPSTPTTPGANPGKPAAPNTNRPATGDDSNAMIYVVVMIVAVVALAVLLLSKKKHSRK